jgi:segregation and condensation protein A
MASINKPTTQLIVPEPSANGGKNPLPAFTAPAFTPDITEAKDHEGVEILVNMAKTGQIDPWNLDLTQVANMYLKTVQQLQQSDLRVTGKVLLYLAILLRMKSDLLTRGAAFWLDGELPDDGADMEGFDLDDPSQALPLPSVVSLETVLKRRTSIKQSRIRPVTLTDLIQELQKIETLEQRQALKRALIKLDTRRGEHQVDLSNWTVDDIETMAHEEFVEDTLDSVNDLIEGALDRHETLTVHALAGQLRMDLITVFLALLFLAARHQVELVQTEFYGTLFIQKSVVSEKLTDPVT